MTEEKTPGLLLQAIPYLGQQKILKIFTPGSGLISMVSKRVKNTALVSPFCLAEWVYKKGNRDIYPLVDGSLIDGLYDLRKSYESLSAAGLIAQDLLRTQMPGKQSHELFALSCALFQKLPSFKHPEILVALFRLKMLLHEGLLSLEPGCSRCSSEALHLFEGESYCMAHAEYPGRTFTSEEWTHLSLLCTTKSFAKLREMPLKRELYGKILSLFNERIQQ